MHLNRISMGWPLLALKALVLCSNKYNDAVHTHSQCLLFHMFAILRLHTHTHSLAEGWAAHPRGMFVRA